MKKYNEDDSWNELIEYYRKDDRDYVKGQIIGLVLFVVGVFLFINYLK